MPFLKRSGQPAIYYEVDDYTDPWKRAPTIVLQHGFARSHRVWYSWVPYLSRHYKVVRSDLRGMGLSSREEALRKMGARGWAEASNAGRRFARDADPGMMNWFVDEMGDSDIEVLIATYAFASSYEAMPYLPRIKTPMLGLYPTDGHTLMFVGLLF